MNIYELNDINFHYRPDTPILKIKHLEIKNQQVVALQGANGTGKSTFLKLLGLLLQPTTGEVKFMNKKVSRKNIQILRQQIALVQQSPYMFNMSVQNNVELGLRLRGIKSGERKKRVSAIMKLTGIEQLYSRNAHQLSGGEKQKIAIARALVMNPAVLLLDEPFTYLDKSTAESIMQLISDIRKKREQILIFSTHERLLAQQLADISFTMLGGKVIPSHMMNIFTGQQDQHGKVFDTGKIKIFLPNNTIIGKHVVIDSTAIVLSRQRLESSMRNKFRGKVIMLNSNSDHLSLKVDVGEILDITITKEALQELDIHIDDIVWVSFKSSAVSVY